MIPYIELRDKETLKQKAIIAPIDCFFELSYYETGEFQIICPLRNDISNDDFVTIPNKPWAWVVQSVKPTFDSENGYLLTVKGYQAKHILNWRINQVPRELPTDLAAAVRSVYDRNINPSGARSLGVAWKASTVSETIDATIDPRGNVYNFLSTLAKTKECAIDITIEQNNFAFLLYKGEDKSGTVIFSRTFDNLLNSEYLTDAVNERTFVLAEKDGVTETVDDGQTGINRKEMYFESGIDTKYTNADGVEVELDLTKAEDLAKFKCFLKQSGREALALRKSEQNFHGEIDTTLNQYVFGVDYFLGDKIKIKEEKMNIEATPRVLKYTISQNAHGYAEEIEVGEK